MCHGTLRRVLFASARRKLLTCSQRSGLLASGAVSMGVVNARSFWWSKSSTEASVLPSPAQDPPMNNGACGGHAETEFTPSLTASSSAGHALLVPDTLPAVVPDEASIASEASAATDVIPPLQLGDFSDLGLTSFWTPAGWVRYSLEVLHVSTGMPWFYVLVTGTMLWRLAATKFTIAATRNASLLRPYAGELRAIDEKAQNADQAGKMEAMLQKKKIFEKTGVNALSSLGSTLGQVVIQFGVFFGVKELVTLPVPQLRDSGCWLIPDLTVAGPYFIMPLVVASLANLQLMVSYSWFCLAVFDIGPCSFKKEILIYRDPKWHICSTCCASSASRLPPSWVSTLM